MRKFHCQGLVVPKYSAALPGYTAIGIHNDHREMGGFATENDPGFISVAGELQRWANHISTTQRKAGRTNSEASESPEYTKVVLNNGNIGGITIYGDIVKSNVANNSQTIYGGLTFRD